MMNKKITKRMTLMDGYTKNGKTKTLIMKDENGKHVFSVLNATRLIRIKRLVGRSYMVTATIDRFCDLGNCYHGTINDTVECLRLEKKEWEKRFFNVS